MNNVSRLYPLFVLCLSVSFLFASPLRAQEPQPSNQLDEVVVQSTRLPGSPLESSEMTGRVEKITREEIEASSRLTVAELLSEQPGITMRDDGGNEYDQVISARGFDKGEDVLFLVDGVRINDRSNNGVDFQVFPTLEAIESIEIIYGPGSSLFGEGAQSAVINIETRKSIETHEVGFRAGSYGLKEGRVSTGFSWGEWEGVLVGRSQNRDGFRDNSASNIQNGMINLTRNFSTGEEIQFHASHTNSKVGAPNALTDTEIQNGGRTQTFNPDDFREVDQDLVRLSYERRLPNGLRLRSNLHKQDQESFFHSTSRVFGSTDLISTDQEIVGTQLVVDHLWEGPWANHRWSAGIDYDRTRQDVVDNGGFPDDRTDEKQIQGLFLEDRLTLGNRLTAFAGVRFDQIEIDIEDDENDTEFHFRFRPDNFKGGLSYQWSDRVRLYGQYGEAFMPPSFGDIAQFGGSFVNFNPDIAPEQSDQWEVGLELESGAFKSNLTYFDIKTEDEIVFNNSSNTNENLDETERKGLELSASVRPSPDWLLKANYTYLDATITKRPDDTGQIGNKVPMVPDHQFHGSVDYQLYEDLNLRAEVTYVDEQFVQSDDDNAREPLDSYDVYDLTATWTPSEHHRVQAQVNNLFDETYSSRAVESSSTVYFSPAPDRNLEISYRYRF